MNAPEDSRFDAIIDKHLEPNDDAEWQRCRSALGLSAFSYWNHRHRLSPSENIAAMENAATRLMQTRELLGDQRIWFRLIARLIRTPLPEHLARVPLNIFPLMVDFMAELAMAEAREIESEVEAERSRNGKRPKVRDRRISVKHTIALLVPIFESIRRTTLGETDYDPDNWGRKDGREAGRRFFELVQDFFALIDPEAGYLSPNTIGDSIGIAKRDAEKAVRRVGRNGKIFGYAKPRKNSTRSINPRAKQTPA